MKKLIVIALIATLALFSILGQSPFVNKSEIEVETPSQSEEVQPLTKLKTESVSQVIKPEQTTAKESKINTKHPAFERYSVLTPQQMLIGFFKDETLQKSRIELILQLVEQGHLNVNEQLREGKDSQHYTPLFAAIASSPNGITPEQFQRFIDLGADIPPNGAWRRTFSMMTINDPAIIPMWFEASGLGTESYERLFLNSALRGDTQLAEYIHAQVNQNEYYKKLLEEDGLHNFIEDTNKFKLESNLKRLERFKNDPRMSYLVQAEGLLVKKEQALKKIAFWKKYADLTPEQIVELDATAIKIQSFTTELREQLAREQEAAGIR